ncbi:vacuolar protein sorting-associated protein 9A isoform X2 [Amborella trichopoda]|uniref:VPS9 domain-containing protein n=1 Tax=Amborella trichopoda TaxID=13333 RepID=W1PJV0_AMBTC|nr:vacuolar protein sorting-associated protein 9A isoform X2 [Amborella trichopoda]ERN08283.1 hypothetical protein AMTR_s00156p00017490 [Amborella trichopoda]|eukprot:XP_006846608.1 vacuolar protein sorting-associated protein 9A isoform X2 [Amborella trichopoda]
MENSDFLSAATAPLTCHDFLDRMRHPSAADLVKSIKSFIVSFLNNTPDPVKDSVAVQEFLNNMEGAFRAHTLWAGASEEELESAGEGLEKYVMTKLFTRAFASIPEEVKKDEELSEKMALVQQFIRPDNLDIKPNFQNETSWLLAQKELQKINMYKAPRDKLLCILHCCKVINNLLLNASIASNDNPPGADEFLPVLIYVTIKANPPQLHSNLLYIQRYRRQSRLVSESAYFFTNLLSAESFIANLDAGSLSMDETEFEMNMESARLILTGLSNSFETPTTPEPKPHSQKPTRTYSNYVQSPQGQHLHPLKQVKEVGKEVVLKPNGVSVLDLEKQGASNLLKEEQISGFFREFPFLYSEAGDLTMEDVEALLNEYKRLALKYVSLCHVIGQKDTNSESKGFEHPSESGRIEVESENQDELNRTNSIVAIDMANGESKQPLEESVSESPACG